MESASTLPEGLRTPTLTALSSLQIICYVTRGKRPFTEAEHNYVFEVVGKLFWRSLSQIVAWKEQVRAEDVRKKNESLPANKRKRPKLFQPKPAHSSESSDTVDSDGMDSTFPQHFVRSEKIVPHAFVHLPEQVKLGGTHQFHNTSAVESKHKECIQVAGTRVRKYNVPNQTEENMLYYTLDMQLFDDIAEMVEIEG